LTNWENRFNGLGNNDWSGPGEHGQVGKAIAAGISERFRKAEVAGGASILITWRRSLGLYAALFRFGRLQVEYPVTNRVGGAICRFPPAICASQAVRDRA